ncbi:MAG: sensor histidine kinase [Roseiflexus sp.]|jgi:signal transduction histidine kinase|nr:sensor histidine kinase [Roseiflexus sp.]MBO9333442.1 sensor histidine kinase [Roseiflexus sp.]MBO9340902.1 sensor histidine kinase [Roseiflexus sp.]MBO9365107.1 sensor histidine kinase [Roseiflexus sp.]MBO9382023.1 sensor histidine kinase [Roseiflexus sp.]
MTHFILEHSQPISIPLDRMRPSATRLFPEPQHLEREQLLLLLAERESEICLLRSMLAGARRAGQRQIARELHDGVAQHITAAYLHLQSLSGIYRPRSPEAREALARAIELTRRAADEVRRVIAGSLPAPLDGRCLADAIRAEATALSRDGWQVTLHIADIGSVPADIELALFRMTQEALQNVRRHAGHCRVWLNLERNGAYVHLAIADDGCGFDPQKTPAARFGLAGMRERVALLGGTINIQSRPGAGTTIVITIPLDVQPPDSDDATSLNIALRETGKPRTPIDVISAGTCAPEHGALPEQRR